SSSPSLLRSIRTCCVYCFFFQAEDGIRDRNVTGVQTCALPISGGEPMVRKADLIRLCEMHPDCEFLAFTNGTLIDEAFCQEMLRSEERRVGKECRTRSGRAQRQERRRR